MIVRQHEKSSQSDPRSGSQGQGYSPSTHRQPYQVISQGSSLAVAIVTYLFIRVITHYMRHSYALNPNVSWLCQHTISAVSVVARGQLLLKLYHVCSLQLNTYKLQSVSWVPMRLFRTFGKIISYLHLTKFSPKTTLKTQNMPRWRHLRSPH